MDQVGQIKNRILLDAIADELCKSDLENEDCLCSLAVDTEDEIAAGRIRRQRLQCEDATKKLWKKLCKMDGDIRRRVQNNEKFGRETAEFVELYLSLLELLIAEAEKQEQAEKCGLCVRQLEMLMRWKCCMINMEDVLIVPRCHPMEIVSRAMRERGDNNALTELAKAVNKAEHVHERRYFIALSEQLYIREATEEDGACVRALPLQNAECLTRVSSIRFIEKVTHYAETKGSVKKSGSKAEQIRIACIGEVDDANLIEEYYMNEKGTRVWLFILRRIRTGDGRLLFQVDDVRNRLQEGDKRVFNLLLLSDLQELFGQFNMVFFMDEGCFYSSRQADKTLEERTTVTQMAWLHERAQAVDEPAEKLEWFRWEYETAGRWLNAVSTDATAMLQFNEKLFKAIHNAVIPECDVYLYIGQGRKVGETDLYTLNLCNGENYDGRTVSVYKVPDGLKSAADKNADLVGLMKNEQYEMRIDIWKLLKSIENNYYKEVLDGTTDSDGAFHVDREFIRQVKESFLVFLFSPAEDGVRVTWRFQIDGELAASCRKARIEDFLCALMEEGFGARRNSHAANYLHKLVGNAAISRAGNVRGVLFAYLLKAGYFDGRIQRDICGEESVIERVQEPLADGLFEARRTVYSLISNLSRYRIRDYDRREEVLLYDLRIRYCPETETEVFVRLIEKIHEVCGEFGYVKNSLYLYSDMRKEKIPCQK